MCVVSLSGAAEGVMPPPSVHGLHCVLLIVHTTVNLLLTPNLTLLPQVLTHTQKKDSKYNTTPPRLLPPCAPYLLTN